MGDESWKRKRSASMQPTECTKFIVSNEKWEQIFASLKRKKTESDMDGRFFSFSIYFPHFKEIGLHCKTGRGNIIFLGRLEI